MTVVCYTPTYMMVTKCSVLFYAFFGHFRFCTAAADRKIRLWRSDHQNNCDVKVAFSSPVYTNIFAMMCKYQNDFLCF